MKKNKLFVSLLAAGMLAISPAMADDVVKLTTSKTAGETVSLQINNADGVTVDWGTGTPVAVENTGTTGLTLTGTLGGSTITIKSPAKLQTLICDNLGLTAIDLSAAPNLRSLYCQNNALTTLDLGGCKLLTDLNCANNKLSSISLDATPVLETVNLSDNELTGTFAYKSSTLQHLNISGNAYTGVNLNSNTNLDVLKCAETSVKSVATTSNAISVIMCGNSAVSSMTINGTMPSLRDVFAENNKLSKLNVQYADNLDYLAVENNQLKTVNLPSTNFYAYTCDNNKLSFNSLPKDGQVKYLSYANQQSDIDITSKLKRVRNDKGEWVYYLLTCEKASDYNTLKLPYVLNIQELVEDNSASYTYKSVDENGEVSDIARSDMYIKIAAIYKGLVAFKKPFREVYVEFTNSDYPDLKQQTTHFVVANSEDEVLTGINNVTTVVNGLDIKAGSGVLTLTASRPQSVKVYNTAGQLMWQGTVEGTQDIQLVTGVYLVNGTKVIL